LADFPDDIDYVLGLHEGAVTGMADVYAQLTGEPTLVNLHTAVGLGNAMGAIINAARAHSPLVITAGQQVRATLTMEPLLANPDPTMLPRPAVKWAFEPPRAQDVPAALARAFRYAALPPVGPVFVSLPMDDFEQPAEVGTTELLAARRVTGRDQDQKRHGQLTASRGNREYGILKGFGNYLTTTGVPGLDLEYLDYEALARGYGIPAVRTARPDELAVAAKEAFTAAGGPHMIIVDIAPGVRLRG
jgi:thiamine pyrophosphate-dependent acetolactate synthase large subunit-like protein